MAIMAKMPGIEMINIVVQPSDTKGDFTKGIKARDIAIIAKIIDNQNKNFFIFIYNIINIKL